MSAPTDWTQWLAGLRRQLASANQRRLLWLAGDADWGRRHAEQALDIWSGELLWIGEGERPMVRYTRWKNAHRHLGAEFDNIVFDAHLGFCPDAFGAVSGTLRGGGLLVLLTPPTSEWPDFADPVRDTYASWPHDANAVTGHYLSRLVRVLSAHAGAIPVTEAASLPSLSDVISISPAIDAVGPVAEDEQQRAVEAVCRVAQGHARRPLVLLADRGRGKSAALGIAAGRLLNRRPDQRILVTAARRRVAETLLRHAHAEFNGSADDLQRRLRFVGAGELTRIHAAGDLVLVDEAAGLPLARLRQWLESCPRIAFATTLHGYEGAGRGFAVRFLALLGQVRPQRRVLWLERPIRWSPDDALEALVNSSLLLGAELPDVPESDPEATAAPTITAVDRDQLARDEPRLNAVVALLVAAHYQTRPGDLRQLLDAPGVHLWLACLDGHVVGVAWVSLEGGFDADLTQAIWRGERRPRGNLLPQQLTFRLGDRRAGACGYARVQRIVVHPDLRRRGFGRQLLAAVITWSREQGLDFVGTSFAAAPGMVAFWRDAGFASVRLGDREDDASGSRSLMMLHPLTPLADDCADQWWQAFAARLPQALMDANRLRDCDPELVAALFRTLPAGMGGSGAWRPATDPAGRERLAGFAHGHRLLADSDDVLRQALLTVLCDDGGARMTVTERALAIRVLLQGQALGDVAAVTGCAGRDDLVGRLKKLALDWISDQ